MPRRSPRRREAAKVPRPPGFGLRRLKAEAAESAAVVERSFPACFKNPRTDVRLLAKLMGLTIHEDADLMGRAYVEHQPGGSRPQTLPGVWGPTVREMGSISIKPGTNDMTRRFAIAHELGHVSLEGYPEVAGVLTDDEKETFANTFASEILISQTHRALLRDELREVGAAEHLVELARKHGVSPWTLLIFASEHGWFSGMDSLWLEVRYAPHPKTGGESRLRAHRAFLDTTRYRVDPGTSLLQLFDDDNWLIDALDESTRAHRSVTIRARRHPRGDFRDEKYDANVTLLKMKDSQWVGTTQVLVGLTLARTSALS